MKKILSLVFVLSFASLIAQKQQRADNGLIRQPVQSHSIVIKFKTGVELIPQNFAVGRVNHPVLAKGLRLENVKSPFENHVKNGRTESRSGLDFTRYQIVQLAVDQDLNKSLQLLNSLEVVEYAEPLYLYSTSFDPNDFSLDAQREYLEPIRAMEAWDITQGSSDIVIAVIDAGVDYQHEDLKNKIAVNTAEIPANGLDDDQDGFVDNYYGWDFAGSDFNTIIQDNDPIAQASNIDHGTWVTGFAAAETNNEIGIAGVGFNSKYMAIKCAADNDTRDNGDAFLLNTLSAVIYAADHGADIINMSFGGTGYSQFGQDVMTYAALEKGVTLVAAAGNAASEIVNYPAGYEHVLAVAATDNDDKRASFTNFGTWIDLSAPGVGILTTGINNTYRSVNGTSFSSPIVAGAAALVKAKYPDFSPFQIRQLLTQSTDFIDTVNAVTIAGKLGTGRLNVERALTAAVPAFDLLEVSILNGNGEKPGRGEAGSIDIRFRNALFNSSASATFSIYVLDTTSVTFQDPTITLGVVSTGEEVFLDNVGTVTISQTEIFNKTIPFSVVFADPEFNYTDSITFSVLVNPLKTNPKTTPYLLANGGDFESNQEDFVGASLTGNINVWELGAPGNVLTTVNSGFNVWKTLLDENLPKESFASVLQTPVFDFSDASNDYRLSFYKSMESSFCNAPAAVQLQFTTDGKNWELLGEKGDPFGINWYNKAPEDECAIDPSIIPDQKGWLGNFNNQYSEYNVSFLAGSPSVTFRFVLFMSGQFNGDTDDGFMIDDFQIETKEPIASFSADRRVIYTGEEVSFVYLSGGASSFNWKFGDGATADVAAPVHVYNTPGTYDVSLNINSLSGTSDTTLIDYITVLPSIDGPLSVTAGGDFESNQNFFGAENVAGSGFSLGKDSIPGKDGTASGEYAWVTALGQATYVDESEAYLYTPNFNFEYIGNYTLGFKAKYKFENTWDGFIVEYSFDKGKSWSKLNPEKIEGWYTTTSNAQSVFGVSVPIFSGNTNGEFKSFETDISSLSGQPNVAFRFVFLTDQNTVDVGMALDDFYISFPQTGAITADFVTTDYTGCIGQQVIFKSTSVGSISGMSWDFGQNAVPAAATGPGPHKVKYDSIGQSMITLSVSGLGSSLTKTAEVLTGPNHTPSFTYSFNDSGNADLVSSEGDAYQWLLNSEPIDGATQQTYEATERGRYAVEVTIKGCPRVSPINVFLVTGTEEEFPFTVFPNPSIDGKIQLKGVELTSEASFEVHDLSGRRWINPTKIRDHFQTIDLSGLPKGQYLLTLLDQEKKYIARIIYQ